MAISGGLVAALVGAGGAVALVVYSRSREKASEAGSGSSGSSSKCDALKDVSSEAYAACKAASGLWGVVSAIGDLIEGENPVDRVNRVNIALNGPTKVPMPAVPIPTTGAVVAGYGGLESVPSRTLEHENGCVPIPGQPGWSKCAPGTLPGMWVATRRYDAIADDYVPAIHPSVAHEIDTSTGDFMKGTARDPMTGPDIRPEGRAVNRWFWKGQEVNCPPGQVLSPWSALRDARNLSAPLCTNPDGSGAFTANTTGATTTGYGGGSGGRPDDTQQCNSFFCWDVNPDDDSATRGGGVVIGPSRPR